MLSGKDRAGFFAAFRAASPFVVTVPVRSSDASTVSADLAEIARTAGLQAVAAQNPLQGVRAAFEKLGGRARILICGSLYLAGEVLSAGDPLT
jgi:dihydrofolate synthase/folylpolyglutamate synthase